MPDGVAMSIQGVAAMRNGMALAASGIPTCCCGAPPPCACTANSPQCIPEPRLIYYRIFPTWPAPPRPIWERQADCCCNPDAVFQRTVRTDTVIRNAREGNCVTYRWLVEGSSQTRFGTIRIREWGLQGTLPCDLVLLRDETFPWDYSCRPLSGLIPPQTVLPTVLTVYGWERNTCSEISYVSFAVDNLQQPATSLTQEGRIFYDNNQVGCIEQTCVNCCLPGQTCIKTDPKSCAQSGGTIVVNCEDCLTRQPGACCLPNGTCTVTSPALCAQQFGTFLGDGVPCNGVVCPQPPTGACCLPDGTCTVTTNNACITAGGAYQGNNVLCANVNCAQVEGACCYPTSGCIITPGRTPCEQSGGTYLGDGTTCAGNPCGVGGCCLPNGDCAEMTALGCGQSFGTFLGVGVPCGSVSCLGCCCLNPTSNSQTTSPLACFQLGGTFYGIGTFCEIITTPGRTTGQINCENPPPQPRAARRPALSGSEAFL